jgi:3-hydroxybutyryl-CoA dehydrogenase
LNFVVLAKWGENGMGENVGIKNIAIIGAGTMGHSLAQVFADGGFSVRLVDRTKEILENAAKLMRSNLETLVEAGFMEKDRPASIMNLVEFTTDIETAGASADFVIEAVAEDRGIKKAVFDRLDAACPPETILASNTSYMDIFTFLETRRPDRLLITHWFAPPHIVPLVEIVRGELTSDETVNTVRSLLLALGKTPVVIARFLPGFIVNRLQSALRNEVLYLLDNGYATPEEIDEATKAGFALRMPIVGLVQKMDFTGLDLTQKAIANADYRTPAQQTSYASLDRLVSEGKLGVKTGAGFYDYGGRSPEEIMRERDLKLLKLLAFMKTLG